MEQGQLQVPGLGGTTVGPRRCAAIMQGDKDAASANSSESEEDDHESCDSDSPNADARKRTHAQTGRDVRPRKTARTQTHVAWSVICTLVHTVRNSRCRSALPHHWIWFVRYRGHCCPRARLPGSEERGGARCFSKDSGPEKNLSVEIRALAGAGVCKRRGKEECARMAKRDKSFYSL